MNNLVQDVDGIKVIASGLPGTVFQAAVENRGVFTDENVANNMAGAMYICTGKTLPLKEGEYNIPEVIAVKGPDNKVTGNYKIKITFRGDKVTDAKLVLE